MEYRCYIVLRNLFVRHFSLLFSLFVMFTAKWCEYTNENVEAPTISNIEAGFRCTSIFLLNSDVFREVEFMSIMTTDQPTTVEGITEGFLNDSNVGANEEVAESNQPLCVSTPINSENENSRMSICSIDVTIGTLRPYPKAPPRKITTSRRKKSNSETLTSPTKMEKLRMEELSSEQKKATALKKKAAAEQKKAVALK